MGAKTTEASPLFSLVPDHTLCASYKRESGVLDQLSWARKSKISGMSDRPSDWST